MDAQSPSFLSTEPLYKDAFILFTPGFKVVPFGDLEALKSPSLPIPPGHVRTGFRARTASLSLQRVTERVSRHLCKQNNVLFIADEIQTGLGRTGKLFASEDKNVRPDITIGWKSLSGGMYLNGGSGWDKAVLGLIGPTERDGSTFG